MGGGGGGRRGRQGKAGKVKRMTGKDSCEGERGGEEWRMFYRK